MQKLTCLKSQICKDIPVSTTRTALPRATPQVSVQGLGFRQPQGSHLRVSLAPQGSLRPDGEFQVDVSEIMNGPNLLLFRNNLGNMADTLDKDKQASDADLAAMQEVPGKIEHYDGAPAMPGATTLIGTVILLVLLLAINFDRIFGFQRWLAAATKTFVKEKKLQRAYEERQETIEARERLEKLFMLKSKEEETGGV